MALGKPLEQWTEIEKKYGRTVWEGQPIRKEPEEELRVRVLEKTDGEKLLEVREYVVTRKYTGPTPRGIRITFDELGELVGQIDAIAAVMNGKASRGRKK